MLIMSVVAFSPIVSAGSGEIKVSGSLNFKIEGTGPEFKLKGDEITGLRAKRVEKEVTLIDESGKPVLKAARVASNRIEVFELVPSQKKLREWKSRAEGYTVQDAAGKLAFRVKVKSDKFNLYDSKDARIFRGKPKDGYVNVKKESGDDRELKVSGAGGLLSASYFALPIPVRERVALWLLVNQASSSSKE